MKVIEFGALTAQLILQLSEVSGWQDLSHLEQKYRIFNRSKPINHLKQVLEERGGSIGTAGLAGKGAGRRLNMFSETGVGLLSEAYARNLEWLRSRTDHRISFLEALI